MEKFTDFSTQEKRFLIHLDKFSIFDQEKLLAAYSLAKKFHAGQERDEGGAYVSHCLRVACSVMEDLKITNPEIICAALLHDAVEDTDLGLDEISNQFGVRIAEMIERLTRRKERETLKNKYQRKYQKFLEIMEKDHEVRMIKACDWLDNMRSWPYIPEEHPARKKFPRWFLEAETMYFPLAKSVNQKLVTEMRRALSKAKKARAARSDLNNSRP